MQSGLGVEGFEGAARAGLAWKIGQPFKCGVDQTWTLADDPSNTTITGKTRRDDKPSRGPGNFSCLHAYTNPPKVKWLNSHAGPATQKVRVPEPTKRQKRNIGNLLVEQSVCATHSKRPINQLVLEEREWACQPGHAHRYVEDDGDKREDLEVQNRSCILGRFHRFHHWPGFFHPLHQSRLRWRVWWLRRWRICRNQSKDQAQHQKANDEKRQVQVL